MLPPPHAICAINPDRRTAPIRRARVRRFFEDPTANPVPRTEKLAIGNHHNSPLLDDDCKKRSEAKPDPALIVSVAVALPLPSKVTEFELNEHVGDPACVGWTEHANET